ncbi:MAG: toll/interleukin-1 receptor domain-containing protein, partial [Planctomycetes bacterium]|nr:toll/interleukin-1 receptor domain-containing protein [Planctomycetota bacterium]
MARPTVFISYSHKDENEKEKLLTHLGVLQSEGLIELWSDEKIVPGADWEAEINQAIARAKVAILFISADFLNSDFILSKEVPALLQRREREGLVVFPVIAKPCAWQTVDWLAKMNVRPWNGEPVWGDASSHVDKDLAAIASEIAGIMQPYKADVNIPFVDVDIPFVIVAMTHKESIELAREDIFNNPEVPPIAGQRFRQFKKVLKKYSITNLSSHYGEDRESWKPYTSNQYTIDRIIRDTITHVNRDTITHVNQKFRKPVPLIRPRFFSTNFFNHAERAQIWDQLRQSGCILIVDAIS